MKVEESLNVTFDESPPPTKLSPLVDDDVGEEEAIKNNIKVVNNNNIEEESVEVNEPFTIIIDHINSINDHLKAQQVMNDSMSKLREMFQTWLQQRQEQVVNLDTYTPEPSQCRRFPFALMTIRGKIDFLLEEFADEIVFIAPIPSGIVEADFDPKGDIRFIENVMYDNSFPRPPETLKDDSETASPPLLKLVSLEVVEIVIPEGYFIESNSKNFYHRITSISFIHDPLSPVFDTLLLFSSENKDNVFNPGIIASNEEKSPHLLSHRGFKAFQLISESPMMISGGDIPILDVPFLHFYPP
ncbi:hypothetical protein Tco_1301316 [Tanacetum coccineum]